jgi:hypothetical protein
MDMTTTDECLSELGAKLTNRPCYLALKSIAVTFIPRPGFPSAALSVVEYDRNTMAG